MQSAASRFQKSVYLLLAIATLILPNLSTAKSLPNVPAFLPLYTDLPATSKMPIDGEWRIDSINKRIRIEAGRAYAVDSWRHLFVLKVKPEMAVLKNIQRMGPGRYRGYDMPLAGHFEAQLQPNGILKVTVEGSLGTATYELIPVVPRKE